MLDFKNSKTKWLLLVVGTFSMLLSGPVFQIDLAGWCIPIGILFFTRNSKPFKGYLWAVLFITLFSFIGSLYSAILPPVSILISAIISGFLEGIPYVVDRLLYRRVTSKFSVLVFPLIAVTYEYALSFPLSSIGVIAATQTDFLPFIQMASITGVFGISFLMYWCASMVVSRLSEPEKKVPYVKIFGGIMISVLAFGTVKIRLNDPAETTVKVAGVVLEEYSLYETLYLDFFDEEIQFDISTSQSEEMGKVVAALGEFIKNPQNSKFKNAHLALKQFEDQLIEMTAREARNGSKIIVWSETNLPVFQSQEDSVLNKVQRIAKEYETTILASMAVLLPYQEGGPLYENKSVLVTSDGIIADEYEKSYPVPFLDASLPGDGKLEIIRTEHGKLTSAICYDADFPELITQSGNADILLLPANDWLGVSPYHGDNAVFRAIENGVSIVRPTGTGQSVVFNPHGVAVARLDAFDQDERIVNAHVPTKGVTTIYNYIGNLFVWLSVIAAVLLIGFAIVKPVKS